MSAGELPDSATALTLDQSAQVNALHDRLDELAEVPLPGKGGTPDRWRFLTGVGRRDLAHARLVEGHLDALAILHELGRPDLIEPGEAWGVWAAQPHLLVAERSGRGWHLHGTKGWCSGSIGLDVALVTATSPEGPRLFAIDPADADVDLGSWTPIGMAGSASHTIQVDLRLPDDSAVGRPDAYVDRPGFWHGGGGVAACWFGGAEQVLAPLADRIAATGPAEGDIAAYSFGVARARLDAAGALLDRVATAIDLHPTDLQPARRGALAVRLAVEDAARHAIDTANVALGAGVLCEDTPHSRHIADLTVYLRQLDQGRVGAELGRLRGGGSAGIAVTATPDAYFEDHWTGSDDPWEQEARFYETRKYDLTAAMPRRRRYRRAFEPGCATGLLTERLLLRCEEVVATDRHPHAVEVTQRRVGTTHRAHVGIGQIPDDWPDGTFDLIVLSEVLYYLDLTTLQRCLDRVVDSLEGSGELIVVHYRVPVSDHALLGDVVHRHVDARSELHRFARHVEEQFVLEGYQRW